MAIIQRTISIILITAALFAALHTRANTLHNDDAYKRLVERVDSIKSQCDSVEFAISSLRQRYIAKDSDRNAIAKELGALEVRAVNLKLSHQKALNEATAYEQSWLRRNMGTESDVQADAVSKPAVQKQQSATLRHNSAFSSLLSPTDLATLEKADADEELTLDHIANYMQHYDQMVMLQLEYERTDSEHKADSIIVELERVRNLSKQVATTIDESWQRVIDNKNYIYNLTLEKAGNINLVSRADAKLSATMQQCSEEEGEYESDALTSYYRRKLFMLEYEEQVAKTFNLSVAADSLRNIRSLLVADNFLLPQVKIKRRAFIEFEPLKVIRPTIYNSKNPIPHTKIYDFGTVFRIRIGIFTNRPNLSLLRGITPLSYTDAYHNGKYGYFVGSFRTLEEAREGVQYLRKIGFRDPVPVVWVDGKYYSNIEQWQNETAKGYNIEISGITTLPASIKTHLSLRDETLQISRIGQAFVVGTFADREAAAKIVNEIVALEPNIKCEINEVKNP